VALAAKCLPPLAAPMKTDSSPFDKMKTPVFTGVLLF
jgi:hypothetical protein